MKATRSRPTDPSTWPGPGDLCGMVASCYERLIQQDEREWERLAEESRERIRLGRVKRVETLREAQRKAWAEGKHDEQRGNDPNGVGRGHNPPSR